MRICLEKRRTASALIDLLKIMTIITMRSDSSDLGEGLDWWEVRFFRMGGIGSEYREKYGWMPELVGGEWIKEDEE